MPYILGLSCMHAGDENESALQVSQFLNELSREHPNKQSCSSEILHLLSKTLPSKTIKILKQQNLPFYHQDQEIGIRKKIKKTKE